MVCFPRQAAVLIHSKFPQQSQQHAWFALLCLCAHVGGAGRWLFLDVPWPQQDRSHPAEVKTSAPVDKGKHERNYFLQAEYMKLYFFFPSCSLLFKKGKLMLPLANLTSILWPEETSDLHGSLNCPSQFPLRVPFSSTDSSCLQLPSFLPTNNPKARSPS